MRVTADSNRELCVGTDNECITSTGGDRTRLCIGIVLLDDTVECETCVPCDICHIETRTPAETRIPRIRSEVSHRIRFRARTRKRRGGIGDTIDEEKLSSATRGCGNRGIDK